MEVLRIHMELSFSLGIQLYINWTQIASKSWQPKTISVNGSSESNQEL